MTAPAKYPLPGQLTGGHFPHTIAAMDELLSEIASFLAHHGMSEREFGIRVLNDHKFIPDLRGEGRDMPRSPSIRTVDRVRAFMREYQPQPAAA